MKLFTLIVSTICISSMAFAQVIGPNKDWPPNKKWPPEEKECPQSTEHFAIVTEHSSGTNNSLYCKFVDGETYKYEDIPNMKAADYIDCTQNPIEINALVLISKGYHKMMDKLGNIRCMDSVGLIKIIGKVTY